MRSCQLSRWIPRPARTPDARQTRRRRATLIEPLERRALLSGGPPDFTSLTLDVGGEPTSVAYADFNADGHLDLVAGIKNQFPPTLLQTVVSVAAGNGDGTFQPADTFLAGPISPIQGAFSVTVGDFDNDALPDIAVSNFDLGIISVLWNTTAPGGDISFTLPVPFEIGPNPDALAVGDLNHDGNLDVVAADVGAHPLNTVGVRLGTGLAGPLAFLPLTYAPAGPNPDAVAVGDLNGDGHPDLAVTYAASVGPTNDVLGVLLGRGDGTFDPAQLFPVGDGPFSVTLADFDDDADLDAAVTNYIDDTVSVLLNDGDAQFPARRTRTFKVGDAPLASVAADFNADGRIDLAVVSEDSRDATLLLGNGNGSFRGGHGPRKHTTFSTVGVPMGRIAAADLNGDNLPDLAVPVSFGPTGTVVVFLSEF